MIKQLSALILFSTLSFPQNVDSLNFSNNRTGSDTTLVSISDTTSIADTLKKTETAIIDTLIPIQGEPLTDISTIINKKTFLFQNYRYTGDLLRSFNLYFIKDLGFVGYPSESFIYGVGDNGVSYLQDGVSINNRYTNSLDLNLVQSEDIDSIEIVPLPRGFLYGPYNNPVTVNFITKDFVSPVPYSRIKYYQGPDGEAMIDGKFSALVARRWNLAMEVTNRSKDETYVNTDLSLWQANAKLKYFASDYINISGSYYYVRKQQGENGGVNLDSLAKISDNPGSDLYQPFTAPVYNPNLKHDLTQHNFSLRTLAKPFENSHLDLSLYYRYGIDKLNDNNDTTVYKQDWNIKTIGGALDYQQKSEYLSLDIFSAYEKNNSNRLTENYFQSMTRDNNYIHYSAAGILSGNILNNLIVPSIFYKYESKDFGNGNTINNPGYGFDLKIAPIENIDLYLGLSKFNQLEDNNADLLELGCKIQMNELKLDLKYFKRDNFVPYAPELWSLILSGAEIGYPIYSAKGLGINGSYKFWILLVDANGSYYFDQKVSLPQFQFTGGLYVSDIFFNSNLDLKAGFKFYYTGEIQTGWYWLTNDKKVQPTNKLDFTLAGEIKKVAIVYFIWENLFDNQYYITPYYPMPERNIRFGLAWELFD